MPQASRTRPALRQAFRTGEPEESLEREIDSLHILPLAIIPLKTKALRHARLIKNSRLETVIEVFNYPRSGSGQIDPDRLDPLVDWAGEAGLDDLEVIRALSELNSFDVYSLRVELRRLGIAVNDEEALRLSEEKKGELAGYMRVFTAPLLRQIYGSADCNVNDIEELIRLFSDPNKESAVRNIRKMSEALKIRIDELPTFLEDYGDIYLSLAYYKQCLHAVMPKVGKFVEKLRRLQKLPELRGDSSFQHASRDLIEELSAVSSSIVERFKNFEWHSRSMWENISPESFREVRSLIETHHATVGGVLCGLTCKMRHWQQECGSDRIGPVRQAAFVLSDMKVGMGKIRQIETSAPKIVWDNPSA